MPQRSICCQKKEMGFDDCLSTAKSTIKSISNAHKIVHNNAYSKLILASVKFAFALSVLGGLLKMDLFSTTDQYVKLYNSTSQNISSFSSETLPFLLTTFFSTPEIQTRQTESVAVVFFLYSRFLIDTVVPYAVTAAYLFFSKLLSCRSSCSSQSSALYQHPEQYKSWFELYNKISTTLLVLCVGGYLVSEGYSEQGYGQDLDEMLDLVSRIPILSLTAIDWTGVRSALKSKPICGLPLRWPTLNSIRSLDIGLYPLALILALGSYRVYTNTLVLINMIPLPSLIFAFLVKRYIHKNNVLNLNQSNDGDQEAVRLSLNNPSFFRGFGQ